MNLVAISGKGWRQHQAAAHALLLRLASTNSTDTVFFDYDSISREAALIGNDTLVDSESLPGYVLFEKWMKDVRFVDDVINTHAILSTAATIPAEHVVIIDARHYDFDLIRLALEKARLAWFPLDNWHPTFAIICDDVYALRLLPLLASTFYSQPQVLSDRETRLLVKTIMRRAFINRWFSPSMGRVMRLLGKSIYRFKEVLSSYSTKHKHS